VAAGQNADPLNAEGVTGTISDEGELSISSPDVPIGHNIADDKDIVIDTTKPAVIISNPSVPSTVTGPVTYTVTYDDAHFKSSTLAASHITLNTTGTATGVVSVTGSGTTRTVRINSITGSGTLGISIAAGTAKDEALNNAPAAGPSATFSVNLSPPYVVSLNPSTSTVAKGTPATLTGAYGDGGGAANLKMVELKIGAASGASALWVQYDQSANKLYLASDAGTFSENSSCTPGTAGMALENSQGFLSCSSTVALAGNDLTVNWKVTAKSAFVSATPKNLNLRATNIGSLNSGWVKKGTLTVTE
jgi:hypothetical protein